MEELSIILLYIAAFGYVDLFMKKFQINTDQKQFMFYSLVLLVSFYCC